MSQFKQWFHLLEKTQVVGVITHDLLRIVDDASALLPVAGIKIRFFL